MPSKTRRRRYILGHVAIRRLVDTAYSFQILSFDETLDLLFQKIDVGREAGGELLDDFRDELLVLEFFALPVWDISKSLAK